MTFEKNGGSSIAEVVRNEGRVHAGYQSRVFQQGWYEGRILYHDEEE
jgi:hypothetical protein